MTVTIPVKTTYDGRAFTQAERDARRAQQAAIQATRQQIAEHRKLVALTRQLDRDLAGRTSFGQRVGMATGITISAIDLARDAARTTTDYAKASIQASMASERLGKATDVLAARYGSSGDAITEAIQDASLNTIDEMAAMQAANQAMLLGVAKTPEEFERLTRISRLLGQAMGQDATKSLEDMTIGIGRQSRLILDNLGIIVNAEQAYENYARTLGKTAGELTESEKKQAFLNEALDQGEKKIAGMGEQDLDTAAKFERLDARLDDLQVAFGGAITIITEFSGVLDTLDPVLAGTTDALKAFTDAAEGTKKLRDAAYEGKEGLKAVEDATDTAMMVINPFGFAVEKLGTIFGNMIFNADALAEVQEEVTQTGEDQGDAEMWSAEAMEKAAREAEELAKKLEKLNEARRDTVRSLIDIEADAAEEVKETWDDYYKETQEATKEHNENIVHIQEKGAKEQAKIQKDLTKSLAKEDKELAKDLAKIERDSQREISRRQQDAAREERRIGRQRQIDAKADERLFQYDMRQLAAEGEFNQIQQALERRAIEQQIEAEKQAEEDRAREEDSRIELDRMQADAEEQKRERAAQAEERKQELRDQAAEEAAEAQERMAEELAAEEENYQERMEQLRQYREEKLAEIEESRKESIAKLAEELTQNKDLTEEEMKALIPVAAELGEDVGTAFAEGLSRGFAENQQIDRMLVTQPGYSRSTRSPAPAGPGGIGGPQGAFQHGGAFTVGGSGGPDSQLVQFMASPGERVTVTPPGAGQITVNVNGIGGEQLAAIIRRKVEEGVNEYHETVIVPWSNQ